MYQFPINNRGAHTHNCFLKLSIFYTFNEGITNPLRVLGECLKDSFKMIDRLLSICYPTLQKNKLWQNNNKRFILLLNNGNLRYSINNILWSDLTWFSMCHAFSIVISLISSLSKSITATVTINQCLPQRIEYFCLMHSYHLKELKQGHDGKTLQLGPGHHNTELQ